MKFFKIKKIYKEKGFSLVEALIAISILMISVAAPLKLASDGVRNTATAKQQMVAYYLTQDAMEYVISIKIGNRLENNDILDGLSGCVIGNVNVDHGCEIDTMDNTIKNYPTVPQENYPLLDFDEVNGVYRVSPSSYDESRFSRQVKIYEKRIDPDSTKILEARVEVVTR